MFDSSCSKVWYAREDRRDFNAQVAMTKAQTISKTKNMNEPMMEAAKSTTPKEVAKLSGVGVVLTARRKENETCNVSTHNHN